MTDPAAALAAAARDLVRSLAGLPVPPTARVVESEGRVACLLMVWDAAGRIPTIEVGERLRAGRGRAGCQRDIVAVVEAAGRPLTRKEVVRGLRAAGKAHGPGTVAKALADLTAAGTLVNPRDKRGYRLNDWPRRPRTPSLF